MTVRIGDFLAASVRSPSKGKKINIKSVASNAVTTDIISLLSAFLFAIYNECKECDTKKDCE